VVTKGLFGKPSFEVFVISKRVLGSECVLQNVFCLGF